MKNFRNFLLFIILFSSLLNCKNLNEPEIKITLPNSIDIKAVTVQLSNKLLNPLGMCESDDKLIIFDNVNSELFKVYSLPDLTLKYGWGNKGKGPEEFLFIHDNIRCFRNELELLDNGILKRFEIMNDRLKTTSTIRLPGVENPINGLQRINDSIYIADNVISDDSNEHIIMNIKTGIIINKFGNYPTESSAIKENDQKYQIYGKSNISNTELEKFIVFYTHFGNIKIYNKDGGIQKNIFLDDKEIKKVSFENREQNRTYLALPYATKNYFYILRINKTEDEILNDINNYNPELLIWDWNGNLMNRYKLDKPLTRYAISEKYQKLYGTFVMKEDEIYVFDLPTL